MKSTEEAPTSSRQGLSLSALALLLALSVHGPDMFQENILIEAVSGVDLKEYPADKSKYMEARQELIQSSLITRNTDLSFIKIHRLVQDVVRQRLDESELQAVLDAAVVLLSAVWSFFDESSELEADGLRQVQRYLPHAGCRRHLLRDKTPEVLRPGIAV
ncbi:hypothetical protein Micbo1qcDRAFT_213763 [Microdochium bolleyi]|uniref:DUF7779 domain-containing protein n=1 Tax=Microdochium bolleyi TaxID=196109 RepID=A0A136IUT1_9PEZI|nr:hypothetical protein Micbo1qcDRAFT_213763 [Microdochium bolleyi]